MNNDIQLHRANVVANPDQLASTLSDISQANPAMLFRTKDFYADLLARNLIIIARDTHTQEVIGSGCLLPLGQNFAEISGIHVDPAYSKRGIGNGIVGALTTLWVHHGLQLLLTMKPSVHGSEGMIIDATRNNLVPLSYEYLKTFDEAYRNCCSCSSYDESTGCPYADTNCILWVQGNPETYQQSSEYIASRAFAQAVPDIAVRERVIANVQQTIAIYLSPVVSQ